MFLEEYREKWVNKEKKNSQDRNLNIQCLEPWKQEVLRLVDRRIESGKMKLKNGWSLYIKGDLRRELDRLQDLYVITPTDKAQNNIIFICKLFFIKILKEELTMPGLNNKRLSTNTPFL